MNKGLPMLLAALLLGGCGHWQSGPDAPFVRWKCQSQQHIAGATPMISATPST